MMNCTKGTIDDSNFSKPMPIIGLYIAGATLLCIIAMVADLVSGFKSRQFWIPARYLSINSASLTIIGVAIKLSVDLSSPMPSLIDQLAKLATSAFICTMVANTAPSLGKLEKSELIANTVALAILIITSIVNICIQLITGVVQAFRIAHIVIVVLTCLLLNNCICIAGFLPLLKSHIQLKFEKQHQLALQEVNDLDENKKMSEKLREYLIKFSMMAQSGCPHFVLRRTSIYIGLMGLALPAALTLIVVLFATVAHNDKFLGSNICSGESTYGWSVLWILIAQAIAVVVGLVTPACQAIYTYKAGIVGIRDSPRDEESPGLEEFWMWHLDETKENPVFPYIEDRKKGRMFCYAKYMVYQWLIAVQFGAAGFIADKFETIGSKISLSNDHTGSTDSSQKSDDLESYFLRWTGEERHIKQMLKSTSSVTEKHINAGNRKPKHLIDLLEQNLSHDFGGVARFDNNEIATLINTKVPLPNCWALPVLTLTSIATALPNIHHACKEKLRMSVNEGLVYVKLVEDNLNGICELANIRAAANSVWSRLDQTCSWLDVNLEKLARDSGSPMEVLLSLAKSAEEDISRFANNQENENKVKAVSRTKKEIFYKIRQWIINNLWIPSSLRIRVSSWIQSTLHIRVSSSIQSMERPNKPGRERIWEVVAAHSMYRVCQTLLQDCLKEGNSNLSSDDMFKMLSNIVADILGACFTNLRRCILLECGKSTIEKRRETALGVLKVFAETERIMEILEEGDTKIPDLSDDEMAFIDKWRSFRSQDQTEEQSRTGRGSH